MLEWRQSTIGGLINEGAILVHKDGNHGANYPRVEDFGTEGFPFLTAKSLSDRKIDLKGAPRLSESKAKTFKFGFVHAGDVLLSHNATVGRVALVPDIDGTVVIGTSLTQFRLDPTKLLPKFLAVYFSSREFQNQMSFVMAQTARNQVPITEQRKLPVRIPPLATQRLVADLIFSLNDKIDLNRRMNETLEAMARAIFKDWFVDFGPVRAKAEGRQPPGLAPDIAALFPDALDGEGKPIGWKLVPFSVACDLNPSERLAAASPALYLDMAALPTSGTAHDEPIRRTFTSGTKFRDGDTLLARITPCLENGKTCFVQGLGDHIVGWGSTEFIVIRPKAPLPPEFGYLLARDETFRDAAIRSMTGTSGRQRVQTDQLATYSIANPSASVARTFGGLVRPWFEMIRSNIVQSHTLAALRDLLLPKLMSGEICIRDAERAVEAAA